MKARNVLIASAAAMMVISGAVVGRADDKVASSQTVTCAGVNSCKGQGACQTATNTCAGLNKCKGQGIVFISADKCKKQGGKQVAQGK